MERRVVGGFEGFAAEREGGFGGLEAPLINDREDLSLALAAEIDREEKEAAKRASEEAARRLEKAEQRERRLDPLSRERARASQYRNTAEEILYGQGRRGRTGSESSRRSESGGSGGFGEAERAAQPFAFEQLLPQQLTGPPEASAPAAPLDNDDDDFEEQLKRAQELSMETYAVQQEAAQAQTQALGRYSHNLM